MNRVEASDIGWPSACGSAVHLALQPNQRSLRGALRCHRRTHMLHSNGIGAALRLLLGFRGREAIACSGEEVDAPNARPRPSSLPVSG